MGILLGIQSPIRNGALLATVAPPVVRPGLSQAVPCDARWCSPAAPDDGLAANVNCPENLDKLVRTDIDHIIFTENSALLGN